MECAAISGLGATSAACSVSAPTLHPSLKQHASMADRSTTFPSKPLPVSSRSPFSVPHSWLRMVTVNPVKPRGLTSGVDFRICASTRALSSAAYPSKGAWSSRAGEQAGSCRVMPMVGFPQPWPRECESRGAIGTCQAVCEVSSSDADADSPRDCSSILNNFLLPLLPRLLAFAAAFVFIRTRAAWAASTASMPPTAHLSAAAAEASGTSAALTALPFFSSLQGHWSELATSAWTGLVAGCLHTLTGPDHLAALAPLSIGRSKMESMAIGALWGCGHDAGQVIFGILFLLLKERLHLDMMRTWGSKIVGLTLLVIGGLGIYEAKMDGASHPQEDEIAELQVAMAAAGQDSGAAAVSTTAQKVSSRSFGAATFITGIVHGLQPDALLVILPALALPSRAAGATFLLMFLLGTIMAMGSYTAIIGSCSDALRERVPGLTNQLSLVAGVIAIAFGMIILVSDFMGAHFL